MIPVAERFDAGKDVRREDNPAIEEASRLEAQRLADAQALAAWTAYKDAQLVIAQARATELTTSTATLIATCTTMAASKADWVRTEVANSKQRINDSISRLAVTIDPEERARIEAEIEAEKNTIDGWVNARPVDAKRVAAVKLRDKLATGIPDPVSEEAI